MKDYINYCTEEQTLRVVKLGAIPESGVVNEERPYIHKKPIDSGDNACWLCPTTQEMFGWLKEQGCPLYMEPYYVNEQLMWCGHMKFYKGETISCTAYPSFIQAELVTIDMALDYLENNSVTMKIENYCTAEQTLSAVKLGFRPESGNYSGGPHEKRPSVYREPDPNCAVWNNSACWFCPTTQEMIEWLKEKLNIETWRVEKYYCKPFSGWGYFIMGKDFLLQMNPVETGIKSLKETHKEAELAAIDSALNQLELDCLENLFIDECESIVSSLNEKQRTEVYNLINNNSTLQATKYIAEQAKCGLKTAKCTIDYIKYKEGKL